MVSIETPFHDRIMAVLSSSPAESIRNSGMTLETKKRFLLHPIGVKFQVAGNELILMDTYGIRIWHFSGIEEELDSLLDEKGKASLSIPR